MRIYRRPNEGVGAEGSVAVGHMQSLGVNFGSVDWARGHANFFSEWTPTAGLSPWQPQLSGRLSPWQPVLSPWLPGRLSGRLSPWQPQLSG